MARLVFDIETIGEDFEALDQTTQNTLTAWIKRESDSEEEYQRDLDQLRNGLGFSPLTGQIVAIGVLDVDRDKACVYFQAPDAGLTDSEEGNVRYRPMSEADMLRSFWEGAQNYGEFIGFNSRCFDVPFLAIRSAIHGIRPSCDLMAGRYLYQQRGVQHIDLLDQLSFYGAFRGKRSLHLWCRAFGIVSPKAQGVTGDDVGQLFKDKKYLDIARYNVGDIVATKDLYLRWHDYLKAS